MEEFDRAIEEFGLDTEGLDSIESKIQVEAKDAGINVNSLHSNEDKSPFKPFHIITNDDRDQAVKERIVPEAYRDAFFDVEKIKNNIMVQYAKSKIYRVYGFAKYTELCTSILTGLRMGKLPERSYIIGAPNGYGKTSFVTECLILLRARGYRVAPYISLWELAQIRVDNEHRIMDPYKKFKKEDENVVYYSKNSSDDWYKKPQIITNGYSYSEYINADCLFVALSDVVSKDIESHALQQLLNIRGAKALPTIVTISTSLDPYENDKFLKEYIWDEIKDYTENRQCYDRVFHVSCYKRKELGLDSKGVNGDKNTGIIT